MRKANDLARVSDDTHLSFSSTREIRRFDQEETFFIKVSVKRDFFSCLRKLNFTYIVKQNIIFLQSNLTCLWKLSSSPSVIFPVTTRYGVSLETLLDLVEKAWPQLIFILLAISFLYCLLLDEYRFSTYEFRMFSIFFYWKRDSFYLVCHPLSCIIKKQKPTGVHKKKKTKHKNKYKTDFTV